MDNSIVRNNLMTRKNYVPYCGADNCNKGMPRTKWNKNKEQFVCSCGWVSKIDKEFIKRYMKNSLND